MDNDNPVGPGPAIELSRALTRDEARAKALASSKPLSKIFNFRGVDLEIHQPSVGEMIDMSARMAEQDRKAFILEIMLNYVTLPGTNTRVFEEADADVIRTLPWDKNFTGMIEKFGEVSQVNFRTGEGEA